MPDQAVTSLVAPRSPSVPSWARGMAPAVVESRSAPLSDGAVAEIELSSGRGAALVTAVVPDATGLSAEAFRVCVAEVFGRVLGCLRDGGFPHPVRMWSFVPGIHDPMAAGMDRYRVFNAGRHDAFAGWLGGPSAFGKHLPAASAVGHAEDHLAVAALGLKEPGEPVENPRQIPAFGYSRDHGPLPPCFARATVAGLPAGTRLLVSGTASIRGEVSMHAGNLERQIEETFENLGSLAASVPGENRFSLDRAETARVYFPRSADRGALVSAVTARLPRNAAVEYVPALICRPELLVEIEATIAPTPS